MQLVINSANIGTFSVVVTFDIYNRTVTFDTSGTTYTGAGIGAILGISFSLIDQSGVELADGGINFAPAQIPAPVSSSNWIWTLDLSSVNFAFLFQNYKITAAIQDADGTIYTTIPVIKTLCQPDNITDTGYVPGMFQIIPDAINSILTIKEITQLVYNAQTPFSKTKSGTLSYPTGTIAAVPFSNTPFSNNVIYTGEYRIVCTTVATYNLQDDVYVAVTYLTNNVFPVTVANKIADLMCCISKLQQTALKNCNNAIGENAKQQLYDVLPYMVIGIGKESSGQDASNEADYIRKYLACDCGSASQSQTEFTPINPAVTSIVIGGAGGTSVAPPTVTGNTKTYSIVSSVYQVVKGNTGDLAFTIATNTSVSNTVQYVITINYNIFAGSILTAIGASPSLVNQLNSLITASGFSPAGLNGLCVIDLTTANYSLSITANSQTIISSITINGVIHLAPTNLFANNTAPILTWLNSLSLGTFTATVAGNVLTILSLNNTNTISTMVFASPNVIQQFQVSSASLNAVLQAIFNYVCGITALQVALGNNLSLCQFDYNGNPIAVNFTTTQKQNDYNIGISNAICNIVARINTLTGITCAKIQAIFNQYPNANFNNATDWLMSVVGGNCTQLTGRQVALAVIGAINAYTDVKTAFCAISCTTPSTCPDVAGVNAGITGSNIGVYSLAWSVPPTATQTVSVSYRVHGTSAWLISSNALQILPNGNINGTTPYVISGLAVGTTYDIWVQNNCGGAGFVTQVTTPTGSVVTGSYLVSAVLYNICAKSPVTLYSASNFATGVQMFTNIGLTTPLTGDLYISQVGGGGEIFNINSTTGVVGSDTLTSCGSGTSGLYALDNSSSSICGDSAIPLYTNGSFAVGGILYQDSALTTPQTGYSYVLNKTNGHIYNVNSVTGAVTSDTGIVCSITVCTVFTYAFVAGNLFVYINSSQNVDTNLTVSFTYTIDGGITGSTNIFIPNGSNNGSRKIPSVSGTNVVFTGISFSPTSSSDQTYSTCV